MSEQRNSKSIALARQSKYTFIPLHVRVYFIGYKQIITLFENATCQQNPNKNLKLKKVLIKFFIFQYNFNGN